MPTAIAILIGILLGGSITGLIADRKLTKSFHKHTELLKKYVTVLQWLQDMPIYHSAEEYVERLSALLKSITTTK
jgi:hypothetical protein